jgi:hypothetical protein
VGQSPERMEWGSLAKGLRQRQGLAEALAGACGATMAGLAEAAAGACGVCGRGFW